MYVINQLSKHPIFQINQHIGNDKDRVMEDGSIEEGEGQGINGVDFANEVLSLNEYDIDKITFYVNCMGGDVKQSLDMFNSISQSKHKTHSIISGFAYSCGGWIPLAADVVEMVYSTGSWMCHMPYDPENPDEKSEFMDAVVKQVSRVISEKSGRGRFKPAKKTPEEILKLMKTKTYMDAEEMEREGLIDRVIYSTGKKLTPVKEVLKDNISDVLVNKNGDLMPYYKEYQTALNLEIKEIKNSQTNKNNMKSIIERLNAVNKEKAGIGFSLTNDAAESDIIAAVARLENHLRAKNEEMMDVQNNNDRIVKERKLEQEDRVKNMAELENKIKDSEKCLMENKAAYDKMKEENEKLESENKEMKEKEEARNKENLSKDLTFRKERAKNYLDSIVLPKNDNIPADKLRSFWEEKAVDNYEEVVTMLGSVQPIKKIIKAPKPKNESTEGTSVIENIHAQNYEGVSKSLLDTFVSNIKNNQFKTIVDDNNRPIKKVRLSDKKEFPIGSN